MKLLAALRDKTSLASLFALGITIAGQKAGPYSLVPRDKHGFIVCAYALLEAVPDRTPSQR